MRLGLLGCGTIGAMPAQAIAKLPGFWLGRVRASHPRCLTSGGRTIIPMRRAEQKRWV